MASGSDGAPDAAAAAAAAPPAVDAGPQRVVLPPFTADDTLGQMNNWKIYIERDMEEAGNAFRALRAEVAELRGASWTQQVTMAAMEAQATSNLNDVTAKGMETVGQLIEGFRQEFKKHEFVHGVNQKALEQVVMDAEDFGRCNKAAPGAKE